LRTQEDKLLPVDKPRIAACMAPKKVMMAVLEYWQGYLFPILDCRINQKDQKRVPMIKAITPMVHFCVVLALEAAWYIADLMATGGTAVS